MNSQLLNICVVILNVLLYNIFICMILVYTENWEQTRDQTIQTLPLKRNTQLTWCLILFVLWHVDIENICMVSVVCQKNRFSNWILLYVCNRCTSIPVEPSPAAFFSTVWHVVKTGLCTDSGRILSDPECCVDSEEELVRAVTACSAEPRRQFWRKTEWIEWIECKSCDCKFIEKFQTTFISLLAN